MKKYHFPYTESRNNNKVGEGRVTHPTPFPVSLVSPCSSHSPQEWTINNHHYLYKKFKELYQKSKARVNLQTRIFLKNNIWVNSRGSIHNMLYATTAVNFHFPPH